MGLKSKKELEFNIDGDINNENYLKYKKIKEQIKSKYPQHIFEHQSAGAPKKSTYEKYKVEGHDEFKKYIKEIADLLLQPDGDFQKFVWDLLPEYELIRMDRLVKGRKRKYDTL